MNTRTGMLPDFAETVAGKKILITGGTGSFGQTMARHLLRTDCEQIRILSRDEWKQEAMRHSLAEERLRFFIGDVRSRESMQAAIRNADFVFHAAALKQVPSCEFFPLQSVETNVIGSSNVVQAAIENDVESVVLLSTDKAVNPANAMGMTKGLMEKVALSWARQLNESDTRISLVRYGNVLLSRGSVVPLFIKQIQQGKPITVTDPTMTRFLMALEEAVDLVVYAFTNARQGDLFVRKAAASTIATLAEAVQEIVGEDTGIRIIGTRPGEKNYETLATAEELSRGTDEGEYFRVSLDDRELDASVFFNGRNETPVPAGDFDSRNTEQMDVSQTVALLQGLDGLKELL